MASIWAIVFFFFFFFFSNPKKYNRNKVQNSKHLSSNSNVNIIITRTIYFINKLLSNKV